MLKDTKMTLRVIFDQWPKLQLGLIFGCGKQSNFFESYVLYTTLGFMIQALQMYMIYRAQIILKIFFGSQHAL